MNTEFNILWFEDNDTWFTAAEANIVSYLSERHFKPNVKRLKLVDKVEIKNVEQTYFDLLLVDLNLTQNTSGNEAIQILRADNILADALFYSNNGVLGLQKAMRSNMLEGVYTSDRRDPLFSDRVKQIIDKIIKRSEDIINIRGLLMDTVSEFDDKLREAIQKYLGIADREKIEVLNKFAFDLVTNQSDSNKIKAENIFEDSGAFIITALHNTFLIDSNKLSHIVNEIFKMEFSDVTVMKGFHKNYTDIILTERNNLAHAKKEPEAKGAFYFEDKTGQKIIYDAIKCSDVRANINDYKYLISQIIEFIK